jgi:hypothetical protein
VIEGERAGRCSPSEVQQSKEVEPEVKVCVEGDRHHDYGSCRVVGSKFSARAQSMTRLGRVPVWGFYNFWVRSGWVGLFS